MRTDLPFAHLLIIVLLFFIALNLFILDLKIFYPGNFLSSQSESTKVNDLLNNQPSPVLNQNQSYCPVACMDLINSASLSARIGTANEITPVVSYANSVRPDREYFIPLGSGETSKNDWDNLIGTETVINPSVYGNFKTAYFLVSLKNPTQNGAVEVRLFNVTDNNVVYGSHLEMNGPLEQTITSENFALPNASKLYRIQIRSTLSYPASLENARLKIIAG